MNILVRLTISGLLIEAVAIFSFIGIARTTFAFPGKQITIGLFLIAIIVLLFTAIKLLSFRWLVLLAVFLTIGFICIYQVMGFALFPGLVKDIMPFSIEHLRITGIVTILVFSGYMGGIFIIMAIKKLLKILSSFTVTV